MKAPWLVLLAGSAAALAGCSDSGGGDSDDPPSYSELVMEGQGLAAEYGDVAFTQVEDMPVSGSATFNGVAGYSTSTSNPETIITYPETVSSITLNADFGDSTISGQAYDFQNRDGSAVAGDLEITGGVIEDNTFQADISGRLDQDGTDIEYDGDLVGGFVGDDAEALVGGGTAVARTEGGDEFNVYGVFAAD